MNKMEKKKKNRGTQKIINIADASNVIRETSYEYEPIKPFPKKAKASKNICKCNNKTPYKPQTWQSITKMYGDADTTEVWDSQANEPKILFDNSEKLNKLKQLDKGENRKAKSNKRHKNHRKSIISIHHKRKIKKGKRYEHQKIEGNKLDNDEDVKNQKNREKLSLPYQHNGRGDTAIEKQNTIEPSNKTHKKMVASNKKTTKPIIELKTNEERGDVGHKTKNSRDLTFNIENIKKVLYKCSFIDKFMKNPKKESGKDSSNSKPAFVMRVNSENLRVMNASEIREKIKKLGTISRRGSCICPSRKKRLGIGKHDVCPKGLCESAFKNKQIGFDCKCREKNNVIECNDSDCDLKKSLKTKKHKRCCLKRKLEQDKQLFNVVLDRDNMNILNSNEMENILTNRPTTGICPTGICKTASKGRNIDIKCRCLAKKLVPTITECTDSICTKPVRKCTLSDLCSRVFRKSEYYNIRKSFDERRTRENIKTKSTAIKQFEDVWCECKSQETKLEKKNPKAKKRKSKKKKKGKLKKKAMKYVKKINCNIRKRKQRNCKQYLAHCLKKKQERCENELEKKEKEFKANEKKTKKQIAKMNKREEQIRKAEALHWNCLAKLFSGTLNIGFQLTKKVVLVPYNLLINPIGSYVYVRERAKDPPGTIKKIFDWLQRTWLNRSTGLSKSIKDSHAMNVISDQIEDTVLYDALFANKGKTQEEQLLYEKKKAHRKKRIMRRQDEALYSCRHSLLLTLRKTPCLWFYHIFPDLYPHCLSFVSFITNFFHLIIFLTAVICWTPCIVTFEICRAFLCCFLCTH